MSKIMKGVYWFCICLLILSSCKKDNTGTVQPSVNNGSLTINFSYRFDSLSLQTDTVKYKNAAGYKMSVSRLQYYVSKINLVNTDGVPYSINQAFYLDAKDSNFSSIILTGIPFGSYKDVSIIIGLDSSMNKTYYLPATVENNNMEWPTAMGGGYHFMKLEGSFVDSTGTWGYNMHLGTTGNAVSITLLNKTFSISSTPANIQLKMNVSEWFKNPSIYNFNTDGVYSMGNATAMQKLKNNGWDVFYE